MIEFVRFLIALKYFLKKETFDKYELAITSVVSIDEASKTPPIVCFVECFLSTTLLHAINGSKSRRKINRQSTNTASEPKISVSNAVCTLIFHFVFIKIIIASVTVVARFRIKYSVCIVESIVAIAKHPNNAVKKPVRSCFFVIS